jgi:electron transport complex protein RnfB
VAGQAQNLSERIDALLPQTQCTRCGYPACRDYAQAIAREEADINQCPPGGQAGIDALARLLCRQPKLLNPANGVEKPREIAVIDEDVCIGCTKCIAACPVDAITGAAKLMHTVISDECSGCELCIAPCPVDCIAMVPAHDVNISAMQLAPRYRARYAAHNVRIAREENERAAALNERKRELESASANSVAAAIARAKARKSADRA